MPDEQSAMMLIVPVGAIVVTVAFRSRCASDSRRLPLKLGNTPRACARSAEAARACSHTNRMTRSPVVRASSVSYGMFSLISRSANPITPRPILRFPLVIASISGSG